MHRYSKSSVIMSILNKEIQCKYSLLIISIIMAVFLVIIVSIPNLYYLNNSDGNYEYKYPGEQKHEFPLNEAHNEKLKVIFPKLAETRPFCGFLTYETNGHLALDFPNGTLDDIKNYISLGFQYDNANCDSNSGLIIGPLNSYDATEFKSGGLSFLVKGKEGKERFGVGMKDISGNEYKVDATNFMSQNRTTTKWQHVFIRLSVFKHVDLSRLDVISLYSNGKMYSEKDYQTIYVANFKFEMNNIT